MYLFGERIEINIRRVTWQERVIRRARAEYIKRGGMPALVDDPTRKIERIRAVRMLRYPFPHNSLFADYFTDGLPEDNGMPRLIVSKEFVERFWTA